MVEQPTATEGGGELPECSNSKPAGKNLVICCDGTGNQFSTNNTNVVRLVQVAERSFERQHVYYDPGLGTLPEPGWVGRAGIQLSELAGLAFGSGLDWKVQEAYAYLMDWWEPGDRVYLFGFSRGAYTVRVLAGLLYELGLLAHGASNMVAYAMRLYASARQDRRLKLSSSASSRLRDEFRLTFARPVTGPNDDRRFAVHFVGVWDTVASVGWVWDPPKYPFTTHNPGVRVARHALSIDERRWFFRPNLFAEDGDGTADVQQLWFPGVHADVGGGYPAGDSGLWRAPFQWLVGQAEAQGLLIQQDRVADVLNDPPPSPEPWTDCAHESLQGAWWLAEYFPKLCRIPDKSGRRVVRPRLGQGRHRKIAPGRLMAHSTLQRIHDTAYAPPNLSAAFRERVRGLTSLPDVMPYEP